MTAGKKPSTSIVNSGGIFQEMASRGGPRGNFAAVPDHRPLPPTTTPGNTWKPVSRTPNSKR